VLGGGGEEPIVQVHADKETTMSKNGNNFRDNFIVSSFLKIIDIVISSLVATALLDSHKLMDVQLLQFSRMKFYAMDGVNVERI